MKDIHIKAGMVVAALALIFGVSAFSFEAPSAQAGFFDSIANFFSGLAGTPAASSSPSSVELYRPALDYEAAVVAAVDRASPSVVSIVISKNVPIIEQCPYDPFSNVPLEFRQFFGNGSFSRPCQTGTELQDVGGGSGFIVSEDGYIITNKHVAGDTDASYTVFTNDGKKYDAKVVASDPTQDIAVIKISGTDFTPITLGDSDGVKLGQTAIAIGNSLGEFRNSVSVGVISGLARTVTASGSGRTETIQGVIQTDAAINLGNSGGPLLNLKGEVIGINTAMASGAENVGFAIPINQAKRDITSVRETGSIKIAYLGVRYVLVDESVAKAQKLSVTSGALVRGNDDGPAVMADSPAAKAGIQAEDVITEINGKKISLDAPLATILAQYSVGEQVTLTVIRGEQTLHLTAALLERPKSL